MPQYWSKDCPCAYCPATSNTTHEIDCCNYGMFDESGRLVPYQKKPQSEQLAFDFPVPRYIQRKRR